MAVILLTGCNPNHEEQPEGGEGSEQAKPEIGYVDTPNASDNNQQTQTPSQGNQSSSGGLGVDEDWESDTPVTNTPEPDLSKPDTPVTDDPDTPVYSDPKPDSPVTSTPEVSTDPEEVPPSSGDQELVEPPYEGEAADPNDPVASMTYEKYHAMKAKEKLAFKNEHFATSEEFNAWYQKLVSDHQAQQGGITVEGGSIDLGDYIKK